jgi:hypothetical protein
MLRDEREQVELALGAPVRSVRQHYLRYDPSRTAGIHEAAGFGTDSTQGFNMTTGFRAGTSYPYWAWNHTDGVATRTLEIPLHVMDGPLIRNADNDPAAAVRHAVAMMDAVERVGGCLTLNWHPDHIGVPGYFDTYRALVSEAAARGAWGCSAGELEAWWRVSHER